MHQTHEGRSNEFDKLAISFPTMLKLSMTQRYLKPAFSDRA
ncbi:MAG TPA: hypothetical protein VLH60_00395 [Sedimentisphaerales bacterium]|nr:hypothetical protein [Sedimentisphaerales bacterium]